ncbi:MAG: glycosyltransferase family 4 protein [Candidatus Acidiferrales bacterium]
MAQSIITKAETSIPAAGRRFAGKRVAMVTFSPYPDDARPRRAIDALIGEGATVDLVCLGDGTVSSREVGACIDVVRIPMKNQRGGKVNYAFQYAAFIFISSTIFALRVLMRRYDVVYVHNMPDILIISSLIPKLFGAKVVLDLHDPMPELMMTIFKASSTSRSVRLLKLLEKWSIARADLVVTVNVACQRIFSSRSCKAEKIAVVMNSPDGQIFPFRPVEIHSNHHSVERPFVIMYHGSLVERNGLDVAIDALALAHQQVPNIEFRIFGKKTPFLERMMEKVRVKGLQDLVRYMGPRQLEELVNEISASDLGVIPNHRNAFTEINTPTRIFEYLILGRPVIAPATPGIVDYFGRGSLLFFEPGNAKDLSNQIEHAYSHRREVLEVVQKAQRVYLDHSWDREKEVLLDRICGILH